MNSIKFFKKDGKPFAKLNGIEYTGRLLSDLGHLKKFGVKYYEDVNEDGELVIKEGWPEWFNHKGITYYETPETLW